MPSMFWSADGFLPEALILAHDVEGSSCGWNGEVNGDPMVGGDCSHLDLSGMERVVLEKNRVYVGNVTMIHESLPIYKETKRTLVRLNVPLY